MKARVKATGEIVEVTKQEWKKDLSMGIPRDLVRYVDDSEVDLGGGETWYDEWELDFDMLDYWTRLEHQYAGMAMQGIMTNPIGFENIRASGKNIQIETALLASEFAHALVEKLKSEEK